MQETLIRLENKITTQNLVISGTEEKDHSIFDLVVFPISTENDLLEAEEKLNEEKLFKATVDLTIY